MNIAVLITSYNRVNITLKCLRHFYIAKELVKYDFSFFLVDDNSPDNTGKIVKMHYPEINIINGSGELYWNNGMRLAWITASEKEDFDFYLWLNDDTLIFKESLQQLFKDFYSLKQKVVLVGTCIDPLNNQISYGGKIANNFIKPSGSPQICKYMHGNIVLIPNKIFKEVGYNTSYYSHAFGDYDYGLRVQKAGFNCYISSNYLGHCGLNQNAIWTDENIGLLNRLKLILFPSKTDFNFKEYLFFVKTHSGYLSYFSAFIRVPLRIISPKFYRNLLRLKHKFS